jgi:hypothetical protein
LRQGPSWHDAGAQIFFKARMTDVFVTDRSSPLDALALRHPLSINARWTEPLRGAAAFGRRSHREWHLVMVRQPG